jgi:hypothetical protein
MHGWKACFFSAAPCIMAFFMHLGLQYQVPGNPNKPNEQIYRWGNGMIRRLIKKISVLVFLLVGVGMVAPAIAQQTASQGNIIKRVTTSTQKGASFLMIRGTLSPGQLGDIEIRKKGETSFVVSIPNALIDPEKIQKLSQKFGLRDPIKQINFIEDIREIGDEVVFIVELEVEARKPYQLEIIKPITSSSIRIRMEEAGMVQKQAKIKKEEMDQKEKRAEKARMLAVKKKEESTVKVRRTTAKAQKTVEEILQQYHRPSIMQLSIINASGWQKRAYKLSVFLGKEKKKEIEESLGIKLDIVNISNAKNDRHNQSTIYFRSNFLKPALFLAKLIPGEQKMVPISNKRERLGVDIEIYLGVDYR